MSKLRLVVALALDCAARAGCLALVGENARLSDGAVDIVIDGNNELTNKGVQCENTVERAPDLRARYAAHEL